MAIPLKVAADSKGDKRKSETNLHSDPRGKKRGRGRPRKYY